jgi:predicted YcjX-like family ATPase
MTHRQTEHELRALARQLVQDAGAKAAARTLGISRIAVLGMASGGPTRAGTFALVRERLADEERELAG